MNIYDIDLYKEDLKKVSAADIPWGKLQDRSILISGATGLIGSFLTDTILYKNLYDGLNCTIYAVGRSEARAKERFACWRDDGSFHFIPHDINIPFVMNDIGGIDYIIHLASNTHPMAYVRDPIGTVTANVIGTRNLLDFASVHRNVRCVFASSNEIYGENRGDTEQFDERYCGYIDCNTLRAGYPESKRCSEALCQAYIYQKGLDIVIPRITRSYGPSLLKGDTKALSQFLQKAAAGEDIVLKSEGTQYYSYLYVADTVSGLLTVMLKGQCGEAYNIADDNSNIRLKDLAEIIAGYTEKKVVYELPSEAERIGYSTATKALLDSRKIKELGWKAEYDIKQGIIRTIDIMRRCSQ